MATLRLKFSVTLKESKLHFSHHGPLFHRWLPNGENDAIVKRNQEKGVEIKFWFERCGFENHGFIEFDENRREVDLDIMAKQGVLDAGPLKGMLVIQDVKQEEIDALQLNRSGSPHYESLGKRIVAILYPEISRIINILRTNFGQYWIRPLERWNSHEHLLGSYCGLTLGLKWNVDGSDNWADFIPNNPEGIFRVILGLEKDFKEYITQDDWATLSGIIANEYSPSTAALLLAQTHQYLDQGNIKYAFIEGITALEIAIEEFIRGNIMGNKKLEKGIAGFWNLPLNTKMITISTTLGNVDSDDINNTIEAIETRNKIVHDNYNPLDSLRPQVLSLLKITSALISGPELRFPTINPGNALKPKETWEDS
ncbi:MAG: hypothetical protein WC958_03650 [Dehalococcoidales bacterium]